MSSPLYAAIDIGTNSTRLLLAKLKHGQISTVYKDLHITRLGTGMTRGRELPASAVEHTISVLYNYRQVIDEYQVSRWRVVATSVVREADNASAFIVAVYRATGLKVEIIPGEEEAQLSYLGVCQALPGVAYPVVVDIGGGSTEFTFSTLQAGDNPPKLEQGGEDFALHNYSIPLGAVRLTEQPRLLSQILPLFRPVLEEIGSQRQPLVGVGGTVTTLAAIDQALQPYDSERVQGYRLTRDSINRILFELSAKDSEERMKVPGLQPERADIIVAGTTIIWAIIGYLGRPYLTASEADILHGIILQLQ